MASLAPLQAGQCRVIYWYSQENDIEIRQDADLLQILKAVNINQEIPVEAFAAVAEIISYIYQQNAKAGA